MEVSRRSWIIGEGNGTLWSLVPRKQSQSVISCWYKGILITSSSTSSSTLSKVFLLISSFFWCHMYDVLVYKMLWD
jgi:hypothetical protein